MSDVSKCAHEPRKNGDNLEADPDVTEDTDDERDDAHLEDVEVGAGCTEIWEHLAERREE